MLNGIDFSIRMRLSFRPLRARLGVCCAALLCAACVGCSSSGVTQAPAPPPQGASQAGVAQSGPADSGATAKTGQGAAAVRVFFRDQATGQLTQGVLESLSTRSSVDSSGKYSVPLANGVAVGIEVQAPADATVVMVDTTSSILDLRRIGPQRWAGILQYYDASNTGDPHSRIIVRVASPRGSAEQAVSVITLHDS